MKLQIKVAGFTLIFLSLVGATMPVVPTYPPLKKAIDSRDANLKIARQRFLTSEIEAQNQFRQDLDLVTDQAMNEKNLDAVNEASAIKTEVDARLAKLKSPSAVQTFDAAAQAVPEGRWHVRYYGGETILTIANGTAHNTLSAKNTGKVSLEGGAIVIRWANGYIDRLTGVGSKIFLMEDWHPADASRFPDELPSTYGRLDPEK